MVRPALDRAWRGRLADKPGGHLSAILFSNYQLIGGLVNELFVRVPALQGQKATLGLTQGAVMIDFLIGSFGPPKYEAARFTMPSDGKTLAIELHK